MAKRKHTPAAVHEDPHPANEAKLVAMMELIQQGCSSLYVAAQALEHGETNLELQCATSLKAAYKEIDAAYEQLTMLRIDVNRYCEGA